MPEAALRVQEISLPALRQLQGLTVSRGMGTDPKWVRARLFFPIELLEKGHQALH